MIFEDKYYSQFKLSLCTPTKIPGAFTSIQLKSLYGSPNFCYDSELLLYFPISMYIPKYK